MQIARRLGATGEGPNGQNSTDTFLTSGGEVAVIARSASPEVEARVLGGKELPDGMVVVVVPRDTLAQAALAMPEGDGQ